MTPPPDSSAPTPPVLEQIGALCSLLLHDLANQLCIISGSASFAQMVLQDPERLGTSLDAVLQASETAGRALERWGEVRRSFGEAMPLQPAGAVLQAVRQFAGEKPGWSVEAPAALDGVVRFPDRWVVFALESLVAELGATRGTLTIRVAPLTAPLPAPPKGPVRTGTLELKLVCPAAKSFSIPEARARYQNIGLLASFELNRTLGGRLTNRTLAPGQEEVVLEVPLYGA